MRDGVHQTQRLRHHQHSRQQQAQQDYEAGQYKHAQSS